MCQVILNVEDQSILPSLKRVLNAIDGVSVVSGSHRKTGMEEAMDDIKENRVYKADSVEEMFEQILG